MTDYHQIRVLLDQTTEWEKAWSKKILNIIQQFDRHLTNLRQTTATEKKTQEKRAKTAQDHIGFEAATKENEERIQCEVLQRYAQQLGSTSRNILQRSNVDKV